jgi:hypothetical protein
MTAREGKCLLAEAMDEYNRNRSGGSDASARGMKAVLKLAHERFASSESITAVAIQIDGKDVYLPTWCAERVRKALEPGVFDMEATVEAVALSLYLVDDCTSARTWNDLPDYGRERFRDRARAAITAALPHLQPDMEALRRERDELFKALKYARRFLKPEDHDTDYIDAALAAQAGKQGGG